MRHWTTWLIAGLMLAACSSGVDEACLRTCDELYEQAIDEAERDTGTIPNYLEDVTSDSEDAKAVCEQACADDEDPREAFICHCKWSFSWCLASVQNETHCPQDPEPVELLY